MKPVEALFLGGAGIATLVGCTDDNEPKDLVVHPCTPAQIMTVEDMAREVEDSLEAFADRFEQVRANYTDGQDAWPFVTIDGRETRMGNPAAIAIISGERRQETGRVAECSLGESSCAVEDVRDVGTGLRNDMSLKVDEVRNDVSVTKAYMPFMSTDDGRVEVPVADRARFSASGGIMEITKATANSDELSSGNAAFCAITYEQAQTLKSGFLGKIGRMKDRLLKLRFSVRKNLSTPEQLCKEGKINVLKRKCDGLEDDFDGAPDFESWKKGLAKEYHIQGNEYY